WPPPPGISARRAATRISAMGCWTSKRPKRRNSVVSSNGQCAQRHLACPVEVVGQVRCEFARVILGAVDEARFPATQIWQTHHIDPGNVSNASIVLQVALAIEDR